MCNQNSELLAILAEIHSSCSIATSPVDINLNAVINEIERLVARCISVLSVESPNNTLKRKEK